MKKELDIKYNPQEIEKGKYDTWLKNNYFKHLNDHNKEAFSIVLPPPNVTGKLHIGHAWDTTLQDIIVRRKRMQGYDVLWVPGADHAGIATQAKVDEKLRKQGINRFDLTREKYLEYAYSWKEEYFNIIRSQWSVLGLSLSYETERFTLDDNSKKHVNYVFKHLYDKGYIYQGYRIINFDCEAKTALSNIEVEHIEKEGALYHIKYYLEDNKNYLIVATTRPETMFADTAVMVNPEDIRYKEYIGKYVTIPTTNKKIPIISDSYVDITFGTGVVKVTPAHDPNDYQVGKRHNLDMPLCMNEDGSMNELANKYQGLDRFECRNKLIDDLSKIDQVVKIEKIKHSVAHSERTKTIVEPRLSKQWFVKMDVLAKQVLENKEYDFIPKTYKKVLVRWLNNIEDWCISRQLWWGHRIPAYYDKNGNVIVSETNPGSDYTQDEDVLDTWFSSALWPFCTLDYLDNSSLYQRYYPNSLLVSGYDIIFFWIARMLFMGVEITKKAPFKDILIHGLIRDKFGKKMSKSLGNGIDPFDIIDKYGADSLRYFLNTSTKAGFDLRFDDKKLESSWNYLNKIWNISRYVLLNIDSHEEINHKKLNLVQKAILYKFNNLIKNVDKAYDRYDLINASKYIFNFLYDDFASTYLEYSKLDLQSFDKDTINNTKAVLEYVLKNLLCLLHPFIPFITDHIYNMFEDKKETIMIDTWPLKDNRFRYKKSCMYVSRMDEIIAYIRNLKTVNKQPLSKQINVILECTDEKILDNYKKLDIYFKKFLQASNISYTTKFNSDIKKYIVAVYSDIKVYVYKDDIIDVLDVKNDLLKQKEKLEQEIKRSLSMLNNENFKAKAPKEKYKQEEDKYNDYKQQYESVVIKLKELE